jgi:hypothetical protein
VRKKGPTQVKLPGKNAGDLLQDAADLFKERAKTYGASYYTHGPTVAALFPNGVNLVTAEDFNRFAILNLMITKLVRYCNNFHTGGHQDSVADLAVYTKMLEEVDARIADGSLPWLGRFYSGQTEGEG